VAAGVQLLGDESGPAVTVRAVCRAAGLTERYFYESFADRDEFVRAVYDDVCARAMSTLRSATTPREAVEQFVALMVDDPVRGRVLLLAPEVEPVLVRSGAEWMPSFIELLQRKLTRIVDPAVQTMVATSLIGGLTALFTAYLDGRLAATREQFIDFCVDMLLSRPATYELVEDAGKSEQMISQPRSAAVSR
jgi:AcrR family transcriptional regulator